MPRPDRHELTIDASGINHFTWITEGRWQGCDVLKLLPSFTEKHYDKGYCEKHGRKPWEFTDDPFCYGNKVKMDLFRRYGVMGAAGDRHLVEFMDRGLYANGLDGHKDWLYHLTTVDYRKADQKKKIEDSIAVAEGRKAVTVERSPEELIELMKAILGFGPVISNANTVNRGQMRGIPDGVVVETNHVFDADSVRPVMTNPLPTAVNSMVYQNAMNIENMYYGIKERNLNRIFQAFMAQPLCAGLTCTQGEELFEEMIRGTEKYLEPWYDINL